VESESKRVYTIPEWPRPGQIAEAWGLFDGDGSLTGVYTTHRGAWQDANGTHNIREVQIMYGLDDVWHAIRGYRVPVWKTSRLQYEAELARRAREKLTSEEQRVLGIG